MNEWEERVQSLREAFDRAFAETPLIRNDAMESLLRLRLEEDALALRVNELAGIHARRHIVSLPDSSPDLLGLVGLRGRLIPVYDLAALLGKRSTASTWRWLAVTSGKEQVGLAFQQLEGVLRVSQDELLPAPHTSTRREHVNFMMRESSGFRGIVSLASLVASLEVRLGFGAKRSPTAVGILPSNNQ